MGLPSAQSLLTSVLRRGGDLPSKILETEATIQGNEATLAACTRARLPKPYETKLKEYEQRLAEIDKECWQDGRDRGACRCGDRRTASAKTVETERESQIAKIASMRRH